MTVVNLLQQQEINKSAVTRKYKNYMNKFNFKRKDDPAEVKDEKPQEMNEQPQQPAEVEDDNVNKKF